MEKKYTDSDLKLIRISKNLHYTDWSMCKELAEKAESEDAKEEIRRQGKWLYRKEESAGGMI